MNQLVKSDASITISFGGDNEIDAQLLRNSIDELVTLIESSRDTVATGSDLKINISSIRPGSFVFDIQTVLSVLPLMVDFSSIALKVGECLLSYFKLKKTLGDKPPQSIIKNESGNQLTITGDKNSVIIVKPEIYNSYTSHKTQVSLCAFFNHLQNDGSRTNVDISCRDDREVFAKDIFDRMATIGPVIDSDYDEYSEIVTTELIIRSPDFHCKAKWVFKHLGKTIAATMLDEHFLRLVSNREIHFQAGDRLPVQMKIDYQVDEHGELICDPKYFVLHVTGDIIHFQNRKQNSILDTYPE